MKNKKGFTLVELIAVIAILAIIALIVVPVINTMLKETRMNAFEDTAYGLVKAGNQYFAKKDLLENKLTEVRFEFPNKVEGLEISGELPESGYMEIDKKGNISLAISNGRYCATKGYNDTKVTVTEDLTKCGIVNDDDGSNSETNPDDNNTGNKGKTLSQLATTSAELGVASVHTCATSGTCEPGTAFAIKVNDTTTYKFYVLHDTGDKVTLMLNQNLGEQVVWNYSGYYADAPTVVLEALKNRTETWINITPYSYELDYYSGTYSGEYVQNVTSRLPELGDVIQDGIGCTLWDYTCPSWMYEGIDNFTSGYWLSSAGTSDIDGVYHVYSGGGINFNSPGASSGVRPVIELSK